MSERKVINKYFPPDFDPSKIPRGGGGGSQHTVRLMTPFSMRCNTCGEYIYKRKKFNARKETVWEENYLGIRIYRFYIKCPRCSAEITFKTDPKNNDYVAEHGVQRNFEPWREEKFLSEELMLQKQKEEEENPMKALETKTFDSKREMEILDALDEIRTINARSERVNPDDVLNKMITETQSNIVEEKIREAAEDDALAKSMFESSDGELVKRLVGDEPEDFLLPENDLVPSSKHVLHTPGFDSGFKMPSTLPIKRKAITPFVGIVTKKQQLHQTCVNKEDINPSLVLLSAYGDSDDDQ